VAPISSGAGEDTLTSEARICGSEFCDDRQLSLQQPLGSDGAEQQPCKIHLESTTFSHLHGEIIDIHL
jgi:hypothetical protein